jgi:hypothetical protein
MMGTVKLGVMDKRSLAQLAKQFRDAERRAEVLRLSLHESIRTAAAEGLAQKEICEATGYTRQQIRRINKAGEEAAPEDASDHAEA